MHSIHKSAVWMYVHVCENYECDEHESVAELLYKGNEMSGMKWI